VDASKDDAKAVEKAKAEELPSEMKGMSIEQRKAYVSLKSKERASIQNEIQVLSEKRSKYIAEQSKGQSDEKMLDATMIKAIKEQAKSKKLSW
jgi:hypothetical protein